MSEFERIETGLGEECGVFGAYDMDGGDVDKLRILWAFCVTAPRTGKLRNRGDRYLRRNGKYFRKKAWDRSKMYLMKKNWIS